MKNKDSSVMASQREKATQELMSTENFDLKKLKNPKLDILIYWYNGGKGVPKNKPQKLLLLFQFWNDPNAFPPSYDPWMDSNEKELQSLKESEVTLKDTSFQKVRNEMWADAGEIVTALSFEDKKDF